MSAGLQCRRVVDAVTGHRDDFAVLLQGLHQAQLLFGLDARRHRSRVRLSQLRIVQRRQFAAAESARTVAGRANDAELARNGQGRRGMVAGDHLHADAGRVAGPDRCRRAGAADRSCRRGR